MQNKVHSRKTKYIANLDTPPTNRDEILVHKGTYFRDTSERGVFVSEGVLHLVERQFLSREISAHTSPPFFIYLNESNQQLIETDFFFLTVGDYHIGLFINGITVTQELDRYISHGKTIPLFWEKTWRVRELPMTASFFNGNFHNGLVVFIEKDKLNDLSLRLHDPNNYGYEIPEVLAKLFMSDELVAV